MSSITRTLLILATLALIVGAAAGLFALRFLSSPAPIANSGSSSEELKFDVRPGESFRSVAARLSEVGLISDASLLQIFARATGQDAKVRMGEYAIRRDVDPRALMGILTSGRSIEYSLTIQEGLNIFEIAETVGRQGLVNKAEFLDLVRDPAVVKEFIGEEHPSLEGYLFPETYHITKFTGAKGLVKLMVDRFKENFAKVHPEGRTKMNRHEIVTLASIIEKETGAPEERSVVSSVFHNRLKLGMRLQTDPTVVYGIWDRTGTWNRNITRADLMAPNRYNTYLNSGLPYGPIANPGLDSLKAAVAPAQTEFLFFVSQNDGTHIFSKEYAQHQRAVIQFQLDRKAREGKSWRDLQKRESIPSKVKSASEVLKPGTSKPQKN